MNGHPPFGFFSFFSFFFSALPSAILISG